MPRNTIALGVRGPEPIASGASSINPFQMGVDIMRMQQLGNENTNFQLQLQANKEIGSIIAGAPDLDTGLRLASQSQWAPWAGPYFKNMREADLALTQRDKTLLEMGELNMKMGDSALDRFIGHMTPKLYGAINSGATDDQLASIWNGEKQQVLANLPPALRANFEAGVNGFWTSTTANAPQGNDPASIEARKQFYSGNLLNTMIASHAMTGEDWKQMLGVPETIKTAVRGPDGSLVPVEMPTVRTPLGRPGGGGFTTVPGPGGQPQMFPAPPTTVRPDEVQFPAPNALAPGTFNLGGTALPATTAPAQQPAALPSGQSKVPGQAPPSYVRDADGNTVPLWDEKTPMVAPSIPGRFTVGGAPAKTTQQVEAAKKQADDLYGSQQTEYTAAQASIANLDYLDTAFTDLGRSKFLAPGAAGTLRTNIANSLNTIAHLVGYTDSKGNPWVINPDELEKAEGIGKASTLLQYSTVRAFFGGQREAAQTIASARAAVPDINTSPLGAKLLVEELRAQAHRVVNQWQFKDEWAQRNFGDPTGAK